MRLKTDFLPTPKKALPISHPARQLFMISLVCCSNVRLVSKMLTGIKRLIATSYANSTCKKDLICSFFFINDEDVTIRTKICTGTFWSNWGMYTALCSLSFVALRCPYAHLWLLWWLCPSVHHWWRLCVTVQLAFISVGVISYKVVLRLASG